MYLYNGGNKYSPSIRRESPEDVRRTLIEVPFAKRAMHSFINIFGFDQMKQFRDLVQLSPNELNNIKPPNVIDQLDQIISKKLSGWSPQVPPGFGVRQMDIEEMMIVLKE